MDITSAEGLEGLSIGRLATELQMSKAAHFAASPHAVLEDRRGLPALQAQSPERPRENAVLTAISCGNCIGIDS